MTKINKLTINVIFFLIKQKKKKSSCPIPGEEHFI